MLKPELTKSIYCIDSCFYVFVGIVTLFYFHKGLLIGVMRDFLGFTVEN